MYRKTIVELKILKVMLESLDFCQVVEATKQVKDASQIEASVLLLSFYDSMIKENGSSKIFRALKDRLIKRNIRKSLS